MLWVCVSHKIMLKLKTALKGQLRNRNYIMFCCALQYLTGINSLINKNGVFFIPLVPNSTNDPAC